MCDKTYVSHCDLTCSNDCLYKWSSGRYELVDLSCVPVLWIPIPILELLKVRKWSDVILRTCWLYSVHIDSRLHIPIPEDSWLEDRWQRATEFAAAAATTVAITPKMCSIAASHIRNNPGIANDNSIDGEEYRLKLQRCLLAFDGVVEANEEAYAAQALDSVGKVAQRRKSQMQTAEQLVSCLFAVRFARSRARASVEQMFTFLVDGMVPRSLQTIVKDLSLRCPSNAKLTRRQIAVDAALCDTHRKVLHSCAGGGENWNDVVAVQWADSSVQAKVDWLLSMFDYCHNFLFFNNNTRIPNQYPS